MHGRIVDTKQSQKLHRTNQGSNFHGGSFSIRDNVRAPIQFRKESQPQHPKRLRPTVRPRMDP